MNNIYVETMPLTCDECELKQETHKTKDGKYTSYACPFKDGKLAFGNLAPMRKCPLKPLTDIELKYYNGQILHSEFASLENKIRAEERKRVCDAVYKLTRELMSFGFDTVKIKDIESILEKFDKGD